MAVVATVTAITEGPPNVLRCADSFPARVLRDPPSRTQGRSRMNLAAVLLMFAVIALLFYRVILRPLVPTTTTNTGADARIGETPQVRRRPF